MQTAYGPKRPQSFTPRNWSGAAPEFQAVECLEAEISELWGHINAATYRFLKLLAEYDRRKGFELHGLATCAQWLNWQCGIGDGAAREKVRVARALEGLPQIADSFRCGVLSYSKVRAVTRIATPENEAALLNIAESGTAAHVERVVRKYRRVERLEAARANAAHYNRCVHFFRDEDGTIIIRARLPAELGEMVKAAIEQALLVAEREPAKEPPVDERPLDEAIGGELPFEEPSAEEPSGEELAAEEPPVEEPAAEELLSEEEPSIRPWRDLLETESNVSAETSSADARDTFAAKRADALCLMAEWFLKRRTDDCGSVADRFQVVVHVDQRLLANGSLLRSRAACAAAADGVEGVAVIEGAEQTAPLRCELADGHALAVETARRLACDASLVGMIDDANGEPLNVGRKTRTISPALERALDARDGGCRFPGCGRTRFKQGHHVIHWANGGETSLGNIVTLCRFHHRLVHEGGFGVHIVEGAAAAERFAFTRPDGTRVEPNGRCFRGNNFAHGAGVDDELALFEHNGAHGLDIDWETSRCGWLGERMDYGLAIEALVQRRDMARRDATRRDATRQDATRQDATRQDAMRQEATRRDSTYQRGSSPCQ